MLLAPGCLNYSLVLDIGKRPELQHIANSYATILGWIAAALAVPGVTVCGSDLLLGGRKVSGSAQRRSSGWLLHHGTLLYDTDATLVERYVREPSRQPVHRRSRSHSEFLGNLPLDRATLVARLETLRLR